MQKVFDFYNIFLDKFPHQYHTLISIGILILFIVLLYNLLKRNFIWILLLILLVPASMPVLSNIYSGIVEIIRYLAGIK
jgi:hypothetical protein